MPLTIPLDQRLGLLHFLEQLGIANDPRCVPDLSARLVQTGDDTNDGPLGDVGEVGDLLEGLGESARVGEDTRQDARPLLSRVSLWSDHL
jgi:hypothetical protein